MTDHSTRSRFLLSAALLTGVVVGGGLLFWGVEGTAYSLFDSIYFALITVSTVGYSELPRMELMPMARVLVMGLIVAGVASVAFFQSSLTAVMVEGVIGKAWRRNRMERKIAALNGHTIVAGCGRTGRFVIEELVGSGKPFVVIDQDARLLEQLNAEHDGQLLFVVGDATDDHSLKAAGVERASGLVTALTNDPEKCFRHHFQPLTQPGDSDRFQGGYARRRGKAGARGRERHREPAPHRRPTLGDRAAPAAHCRVLGPDDARHRRRPAALRRR
ncbi:MAG TPA: NAD-binding protein [Polyangiaceae bacterium]|nr:NAD-binding protein [Polyangiaceae bacterium]